MTSSLPDLQDYKFLTKILQHKNIERSCNGNFIWSMFLFVRKEEL